jgi:predicted dehydrogenase
MRILVVGAGPMAQSYLKVLQSLGHEPVVVSRTQASADKCKSAFNCETHSGGLEALLEKQTGPYDQAIVAVDILGLAPAAKALLKKGVKRILVEKPGSLEPAPLVELEQLAKLKGAEVYLAYNRRFFASVLKARELVQEDGGLTSVHFDFTEWADKIAPLPTPPEIKARWVIANSSHVIDLAFYFAGLPREIDCRSQGGLSWHPASAVFGGAGKTEKDVSFAYRADWTSAGRWGVELFTCKRRLVLRPLEELYEQKRNSVEVAKVEVDDRLDKEFKPGLFRQTIAFLNSETADLSVISSQLRLLKIITRIAAY